MSKKAIQTENAPKAIGPYSQAILSGSYLFCSGQIPLNPQTMQIESQDIRLQTQQVLKNLKAVIEAAGGKMDKVVKTTVFLTDLKNFEVFNKEYDAFFGQGTPPARSTIEVSALPKAALVEIEAIVVI
jgi:2-iminobutanoate/2-iminopropanoate deaminase